MPPKPPPPPPNVSTPRRRHRGAASSRSKLAAKELSSPHRPLRPSRKRLTRRHHRRHKADDVVRVSRAATPPHQTAGDTSPATRPLPPFAKAADPGRRPRTSPTAPSPAPQEATSQEALRRARSSSSSPRRRRHANDPDGPSPGAPFPPRAGRWSAVKDIRQHRSRTREIRRVLVWGPPPRSA